MSAPNHSPEVLAMSRAQAERILRRDQQLDEVRRERMAEVERKRIAREAQQLQAVLVDEAPAVTPAVRDQLIHLADERTRELIAVSNEITHEHGALIDAMAQLMIEAALGECDGAGQLLVTASIGLGKSTSVRAVIETLHRYGPENVGVLWLLPRIEEGDRQREDLIAQCRRTKPIAEHVGHCHSKRGGLTAEQAKSKRFVISTHARSRMREIDELVLWNGKRRLVVIDESLQAAWAYGSQTRRLRSLLVWGVTHFEGLGGKLAGLSDYLRDLVAAVEKGERDLRALPVIEDVAREMKGVPLPAPPSPKVAASWNWALEQHAKTLRELRKSGQVNADADDDVGLDFVTEDDEAAEEAENSDALQKQADYMMAAEIGRLIEGANLDPHCRIVEVIPSKTKGGATQERRGSTVLQHRSLTPACLADAIVLDAGAEANMLTEINPKVRLAHKTLRPDGRPYLNVADPAAVKDWSDVRIDWVQTPGGRYSVKRAAEDGSGTSGAMFEHAADWVERERPAKTLFVTFKSGAFEKAMRSVLEKRNYDQRKVRFISWGLHDATNLYSDFDAVVLLGVIQQDSNMVAARILGVKDNVEEAAPSVIEKRDAKRGLEAEAILQAIGRGCCRLQGPGGKAKGMRVLLFQEYPAVLDLLRPLMKGVQIEKVGDWRRGRKAGYGGAPRGAERVLALNVVGEQLVKLAARGVQWTTAAAVKVTSGFAGTAHAFKKSLAEALENSPDWARATGNTSTTGRASLVLLRKDTCGRTIEDRIRAYLADRVAEGRVATVKLNEALKPPAMAHQVFNKVTEGAIEETSWKREARTLIYVQGR